MIRSYSAARWRAAAPVLLLALSAAACGSVDDVFDGDGGGFPAGSSTLYAEVRAVDARRGLLQVRDERDGRTETLRVDSRTRVVYRDREYPVSALERGDRVSVRVARGRDGERWADRIEVRQSVSDDRVARSQRIEGTVTQVDVRRGAFALQQSRSSTVVVYVPNRIGREDERRFERLRRGDRARVEVRPLGRGQAELIRFR